MALDFHQITGKENGKRENFSSLCNRIIIEEYPGAKPVEGKGGDDGADTFIGIFNGECIVFQHKYHIDGLKKSQRSQIKSSIKSAVTKHKIKKWFLLLPIELNPSEIRWFQELQQEYPLVSLEWWGKEKLNSLLGKYPNIEKDFAPIIPIRYTINVFGGSPEEIVKGIQKIISESSEQSVLGNATYSAANEVARRFNLKILLWNSGRLGVDVIKKRNEIYDKLKKLGHDTHLRDNLLKTEIQTTGLNFTISELVHAQSYDYIIVFWDSPEIDKEIKDIIDIIGLSSKMMICVDNEFVEKYSQHPFIDKNVCKFHGFQNPSDLVQCNLATTVISQVVSLSETKQWIISGGGFIK